MRGETRIPYFKFKESKLYYAQKNKQSKKGMCLVFIHGSGESSEVWRNQLDALNDNIELIAIDLPGHGKSEKMETLSMEVYIDVIRSLRQLLGKEKLIIAGHSLGGAIAQSFYFKYPNYVQALILCATGAKLRVNNFILNSLKNDFEAYLESIPIAAFYRKTQQSIKTQYVNQTKKMDPLIVYTDFSICDQFDTREKTPSITVSTLIIVGEADKLTPPKYSEFFEQHIEDAQLIVIEKAGHMVMLENPEKVNKKINNFVKSL